MDKNTHRLHTEYEQNCSMVKMDDRSLPNPTSIRLMEQTNNDAIHEMAPLERRSGMRYKVDENPPWDVAIFMAFQHYLIVFVSNAPIPMIFAGAMCLPVDGVDITNVINTTFLVIGTSTLLQCTIGVRLPIIQGTSVAYLLPMMAVLSQPRWKCPETNPLQHNITEVNVTSADNGSPEDVEVPWMARMREIQGCLIMASLFQMVVGASGAMNFLLRIIGPMTITPTIALIGLSLYQVVPEMCSPQWGIAGLTVVLVTLFSLYLGHIGVPADVCGRPCRGKKCCRGGGTGVGHQKADTADEDGEGEGADVHMLPIFSMFSFMLGMCSVWLLCYILTVSGAFPDDSSSMGYWARTDLKTDAIHKTPWFRVPYPFQWGWPTFTFAGSIGMMAASMTSMVESVGDYYACAKISDAPPPPVSAVNRGLLTEGVGVFLAGIWGSGLGCTSLSQSIAALGITRVASRRVIIISGFIMVCLAMFGKFGAVFVTIPTPIVGGIFLVMFGMVMSVGISNLQYVDLNSTRNMYILGVSVLIGLSVPEWVKNNQDKLLTGNITLDQIVTVFLNNGMFLGGATACILDNTVKGTLKERGMDVWQLLGVSGYKSAAIGTSALYDLPYASRWLHRQKFTKYLPFCSNYNGRYFGGCGCFKASCKQLRREQENT